MNILHLPYMIFNAETQLYEHDKLTLFLHPDRVGLAQSVACPPLAR